MTATVNPQNPARPSSAAGEPSDLVRVREDDLRPTVQAIFEALGMPRDDAAISTDALVQADLMGVSSHGVSNYIQLIYEPGLRTGTIEPRATVRAVHETPVSALVDGGGGMGHVVGRKAMEIAIDKARSSGIGVVAVRGSRHYGMAGYYSMMAIDHDMIGLSLTNADALVLPLFGRQRRLGTNPIAVAIPAGSQPPFLLDMATSTVPLGKIMLAARAGQPIPEGWAADKEGRPTTDAKEAFAAFHLLPLGGASYEGGGHKGYSLALVVEVLCGALAGAQVGTGEGVGAEVGHFFAALRVDLFRPVAEFKAEMDQVLERMRSTAPVDPAQPVIYAGIKEHQARADRTKNGIPLHPQVVGFLRELTAKLGCHCQV